jgi:hypothetical protein
MWLACLLPPDSLSGNDLDPYDDNVLRLATWTMHSVQGLASALGDDPDEVAAAVFGSFPSDYVDMLRPAVAELYGKR